MLKLIERGTTRDDLWRLLMLNTRLPEALDGDLRAMIGSTRIGAERLALLVEELGVDTRRRLLRGRARPCRPPLPQLHRRAWPQGVWRAEEAVDNDCFEPIDGRIAVTLTVKDDRLIVDFAGTSPQVRGFKNSSIANSYLGGVHGARLVLRARPAAATKAPSAASRSACPKARW